MSKEQQTEILRKFIKDYHSKPTKKDEPGHAETNRPNSNYTSSNNHSSDNNQKLQQQLKKRQSTIEKLYRRSVVNKIYIFPKLEERMEDLLSVSSHSSIDEMDEITTYRVGEQNRRRHQESSCEKFLKEYRSQHDNSESKGELGAKEYLKKARKRVESSKRLLQADDSRDSGRIIPFNNASGASIRHHQTKKNDSILSARPDTNQPDSAKQHKSKKQAYQQLLQRLESKSKDERKYNKNHSISNKSKPSSTSQSKKPPLQREPFANISITKILDKYSQIKYAKGRDERCRTEY